MMRRPATRDLAALAVSGILLAALTGCTAKGDQVTDCSSADQGMNMIHRGGNSSAIIDPPLPSPGAALQVGGGRIAGDPPSSELSLLYISAEIANSDAPGVEKTVDLKVGESATFHGFTVTVTAICDNQTFYSTTADESLRATTSASPTP